MEKTDSEPQCFHTKPSCTLPSGDLHAFNPCRLVVLLHSYEKEVPFEGGVSKQQPRIICRARVGRASARADCGSIRRACRRVANDAPQTSHAVRDLRPCAWHPFRSGCDRWPRPAWMHAAGV